MNALAKVCAALLALGTLVGCGWQLQGMQVASSDNARQASGKQQPRAALSSISLRSKSYDAKFTRSLTQMIKASGISLQHRAQLDIMLEQEKLDKSPLTTTRTGVAAQYQLLMEVSYRYRNNVTAQLSPIKQIRTRRKFDFNANLIFAKNEEEKLLREEMREELARRILADVMQSDFSTMPFSTSPKTVTH